jgi:predicted ATP-grasp superfamily ATP-dependent carboligase
MPGHVLICGVSTRAAAESAALAGFRVTAIDAFADADQHPSVRALSVPRDFGMQPTTAATARAAGAIECDAFAYLSGFENHPRLVSRLACRRALWGNPPDVLRRVRDPFLLADVLRRHGFAVPEVRLPASARHSASHGEASPKRALGSSAREGGKPDIREPDAWMVKPFRSGGGRGIRPWSGGRIARDCYLQQRVDGTPGSIVFVCANGAAVPLGVSRQLVGDAFLGASGYRYCGSILASVDDPQFTDGAALVDAASTLARLVTAELGLRGVNGIDFVAKDGVPHVVEVNPRWSSSMELVERLFGLSVFGAHAGACERAVLPQFDLAARMTGVGAIGKAIVFARRDVVVGDTRAWLDDRDVRDVPHPGERFTAGQPVCTVFATADDAAGCYRSLVVKATDIFAELERRA